MLLAGVILAELILAFSNSAKRAPCWAGPALSVFIAVIIGFLLGFAHLLREMIG
jgi:tetrahydromethanopterin S-methyltransferase subunit C